MFKTLFRMKRIAFCLVFFITTLLFSCSSTEDTDDTNSGLSNNPVSGTVYEDSFVLGGGRGAENVEFLTIELTSQSIGCDDSSIDFPITIYAPYAVGIHTTDVSVTFEDPNTDDFVSVSSGVIVEIQSIGTTIVGRVKATSISTDNSINGKFTVPVCQ
jgi:hypothetical protein